MIYLDNAATSFPKPETVHQAIEALSRSGAGNPGRGMHRFAQSSEAAIREARRTVARQTPAIGCQASRYWYS